MGMKRTDRTGDAIPDPHPLRLKPMPLGVPEFLRRSSALICPAELARAYQYRRQVLVLDADNDGRISWDEFRLAVFVDPSRLQCLAATGIGQNGVPLNSAVQP